MQRVNITSVHRTLSLALVLMGSAHALAGNARAAEGAEAAPVAGGPIVELERFIVEEKASDQNSLSPMARPVRGIFGDSVSVLDIPRSVTVLTPEAIKQYGLRDFSDLEKVGAGTARINYFGLPGSPVLRGVKAGVYFDGILRAFQRNEMPTSFGSIEQMDIVKGPAPAHFSPTLTGGFVNFIPKAPYFEKERYAVSLTLGSWDYYHAQLDAGAPFMLGSKPAAYRISISGQNADSYYDRVKNDYLSVYGSLKTKLAEGLTLTVGGEVYHYKSNENPGINRPTQELIDHGRYVIGEPADISSAAWGGNAVRTLVEFPYNQLYINPSLNALAIPGPTARAAISPALLATMIDLNDPAQRAALYSLQPNVENLPKRTPAQAAVAQAALDQAAKPAQDAYVYTKQYFDAGGKVLTAPIEGNQVLSDSNDYADADDFIAFFKLEGTHNPDRHWRNQLFMEGLETDKLSTYGYGVSTRQFVIDNKFTVTEWHDFLDTELNYGGELRGSYARTLQDFFAEPFSRRDITQGTISTNSIILAGPQRDPNGRNLWSPGIGANLRSQVYQEALFVQSSSKLMEKLTLHLGLRGEYAQFCSDLPSQVDRSSATLKGNLKDNSDKPYYMASISPVFEVTKGLNLYAAVQVGTGIDPATGGVIFGDNNFTETELYETGVKTALLDGQLVNTLAFYYWDQTKYSERDGAVEPLRGQGIEWESTYLVTERFTLTSAFTAQRVNVRKSTVGYGAIAQTEQDWALNGGILNSARDRTMPNNPELNYAGSPEVTASLFAMYEFPFGLGISGGPQWRDGYWHNFDHTIRIPSVVLWNANIFYRYQSWEVFLAMTNLTNEDYYTSAEPTFAGNTLIGKGLPLGWKLTVSYTF
ncbi:MAG: TonB-dependent receptor plug domain-containing protein [Verrucomicrobiota bacterium]|nr:TonB-dependent receptor plug domain-containing protein [Verrucomicrobiota bacterium]